jgi:hypothetical protein
MHTGSMKLVATAFLAMVFLNSCSGGGGVQSQPQPQATDFRGVCAALLVNDPRLALVAPAPGATGVPATVGSITFSASSLLHDLALFPSDGSAWVAGGPITPVNGNYVSSIPALKLHMTYTVLINISAGPCAYVAGSFTTQ